MSEPVLVIGVGNPYRRDDGIGVAVLNRLQELAVPGISIVEESGEPAALIARWSDHSLVIMVDAVSSGAAPGTIHHLECGNGVWEVRGRAASASTHGLGVGDAVELGKLLDQLPERLVIVGVETEDVRNGTGLSGAVATAVDPAAREIANLVTLATDPATTAARPKTAVDLSDQGSLASPASQEPATVPADVAGPASTTAVADPTCTEVRATTLARTIRGLGSA